MLASPVEMFPKGEWVAEEKFDGHRLIVRRTSDDVLAWSRVGNARPLPPHIRKVLVYLPIGVYDGELIVQGGYSSNVKELGNEDKLQLVLFDMLERHDDSIMQHKWTERRLMLEAAMVDAMGTTSTPSVYLASLTFVKSWDDVAEMVGEIWERGGEGVILKNMSAVYRPGKRSKDFLKVKELKSATLTVIGFCPSESEKQNRGPYGTTVLKDDEGNYTVVKTLDDAMLERCTFHGAGLEPKWEEIRLPSGRRVMFNSNHPYVGKRLCIEYQMRTEDKSYRHPRWDHWEGE